MQSTAWSSLTDTPAAAGPVNKHEHTEINWYLKKKPSTGFSSCQQHSRKRNGTTELQYSNQLPVLEAPTYVPRAAKTPRVV